MFPIYKKWSRTLFDIGMLALTIFFLMHIFNFLYMKLTPFFFAFVIFVIIEPFARFLNKKGLKKKLATTISTLTLIGVIVTSFVLLGSIVTVQTQNLISSLPKYSTFFEDKVMNNIDLIQDKINSLPPETIEKAKEQSATVIKKSSDIASTLLVGVFTTLSSGAKFAVNCLIGLIIAYLLSIEFDSLKNFFSKRTPKTLIQSYGFIKENVLKGILGFGKAQLILIACTFVIVLIAFLILGVENALTLALIAALLDLLPLLGMPVLFFPWAIYSFFSGEETFAFTLIGVWLGIFIFRQIAEPKITGDSLGVSAFTMISVMIASISFFGVAGLILSPILTILVKALYEQGYLKKWIHIPQDELEPEFESESK